MKTRITLNDEFSRAVAIRGLTVTEVARRAGVSLPTASSALRQRPLNVATALRLCRAVAGAPIVAELEVWAGNSGGGERQL